MGDSQTNRQRLLLALGALGAVASAPNASALEFGRISLNSHLNQPLAATLRLSSVTASEKASLDVHIASPALFKRFGIERSSEVDNLDVTTAAGEQPGQVVVSISTRRPVREPFVDFLLEASTSNGSGLREYTVLLNPEGAGGGPGAAQSMPPSANAGATHAGPGQAHPMARSAGAVSHADAGASSYGPVRGGDTLSAIAAALRPPGVTTAQMTVALFNANPQAFAGGINQLIRGAHLSVPAASQARAISSEDIRAQLEQASSSAAPTDKATGQARKPADNEQGMAQASGESPPASLGLQPAGEAAGVASADGAVDHAAFGQLSMPRTEQWPQELTTPQTPAADGRSGTAAAPTDGTQQTTADTTSSAGSKSSDVSSTESANGGDNAPEDVTEGGDAGWWSPRNLLLTVLLLVLLGGGLMLRRRQQYKSVPMDFEGIDPDADEETTTGTPTAEGVAEPAPATAVSSQDRVPQQPPASTPASKSSPTSSSRAGGEFRQRRNNIEPEAAGTTDRDDFVPAILRHRTTDEESGAQRPAAEDDTAKQSLDADQAANRDHADASVTGSDNTPDTTTADYVFESQIVAAQPERQHDRGNGSEWAFDINADATRDSTSGNDRSAGTSRDGGPDLIDPQAFSLDDSSDTGGASDTALDSDTVAIRLDLANMYIEMEDLAMARGLLEEVIADGDPSQKDKARSLLEQC